jgi:N utilization substance protein B
MTKHPARSDDGEQPPADAWTGEGRSAARLAAVQALYEIEMTEAPTDSVLMEFMARRWNAAVQQNASDDDAETSSTPAPLAEPDEAWLREIVRGTAQRKDELDTLIAGALAGGRTMERLEMLIKAVLRAAAYELLVRIDVPPRVIITEYVEVAYAFFAGSEPAFINGVLDAVARKARPSAFEGQKNGAR